MAVTASSGILVAGATGYLGGELTRRLTAEGSPPRAIARSPERAAPLAELGVEVVRGDVLEPNTLEPALDGIETAYYLVHSMGRGSDGDFAERDREAAANFAAAAKAAGVSQIIYMGGLGEGKSKHLRSRHETAEVLGSTGVPVTYFRAAAVIGAGSESLRTIYYLVKRLPAMVTPRWTTTRTQPIAADDVVEYLKSAPATPGAIGREIEIGGPEVTTYGGLMDAMAEAIETYRRPQVPVPLLTPWLSSQWIGLITPVDAGVAKPLIEGLSTETIVADPSGMQLFDVEATPIDAALRDAVRELEAG